MAVLSAPTETVGVRRLGGYGNRDAGEVTGAIVDRLAPAMPMEWSSDSPGTLSPSPDWAATLAPLVEAPVGGGSSGLEGALDRAKVIPREMPVVSQPAPKIPANATPRQK